MQNIHIVANYAARPSNSVNSRPLCLHTYRVWVNKVLESRKINSDKKIHKQESSPIPPPRCLLGKPQLEKSRGQTATSCFVSHLKFDQHRKASSFATLTKCDAFSLQKPLREIMQRRSRSELVSFPMTGSELIEEAIKAGGESLRSW